MGTTRAGSAANFKKLTEITSIKPPESLKSDLAEPVGSAIFTRQFRIEPAHDPMRDDDD